MAHGSYLDQIEDLRHQILQYWAQHPHCQSLIPQRYCLCRILSVPATAVHSRCRWLSTRSDRSIANPLTVNARRESK